MPEDPALPLPFLAPVGPVVDDVRRADSREPLVAVEPVADPVLLDEDRPDVDRDDVDVVELPDDREPEEPEELEVVDLDEFEAADEAELDESESDEAERDESDEPEEGDDGSPFIRFRTYVSCPSRS